MFGIAIRPSRMSSSVESGINSSPFAAVRHCR
jgi:hypothetical protein